MDKFVVSDLKKLYLPPKDSHKGQNGRLTIIGGSKLFHGASLWALKVASRIVDMVFYSSIPENNQIAQKLRSAIYDFIWVPREKIDSYIKESDCVLIGPGMVRKEVRGSRFEVRGQNLREINKIKDEGEQSYWLTKYLLNKYPTKKWVVDAGSLQMMEREWLKELKTQPILTPHVKEFFKLFGVERVKKVKRVAKEYHCTILLKGQTDIVCSPDQCKIVEGGNAGMTKGGTGDVLAGLVAAFYCKNEAFLSACAASFINKKAGEELFEKVGYYFNASDLADQIPRTMKNS